MVDSVAHLKNSSFVALFAENEGNARMKWGYALFILIGSEVKLLC